MKKSRTYQPDLIENLRDPREAEEYLNAALEENHPELFLLALRMSPKLDLLYLS